LDNENKFLKIITYAPLFFIPLIVGLVSYASINQYNESFKKNLEKIEKNLYDIKKQSIKTKVENTIDNIVYNKSVIKQELINTVKSRVYQAYSIADSIYEKNKLIKSSEEIKQDIKIALEPLIWNNAESFIWIIDHDGILNLAPSYLKHLEGSSIINFVDATGRYVIQEEIALCKKSGEGFLWDTFTKPSDSTKTQYEQVAFVKSFEHYNWYLGSAEYLDTATKKSDIRLIKSLQSINRIDKSYIFIINEKGELLLNNNISHGDKELAKKVIKQILDSSKKRNFNFISYKWLNPSSKKVEMKYSYIKKIPNSDWIVGSGFYISDINTEVLEHKVDMYDVLNSKSNSILYIAMIVIIISLIIAFYITKNLRDNFTKYKVSLDTQKDDLKELNETLEHKVEERTLELRKMKDDFEKLATVDSLTNVHNRYSLMKNLSTEINRSKRQHNPLSLIILDIDFFKKVNDTYGHDIGDNVLVTMSSLLENNLRDIDIIGRYGGEEFLIILPYTKIKDAEIFAQRLRIAVSTHIFDTVNDNITVSMGLVELLHNENINQIFKRVDKLLYRSKEDGRNRVSF